jgi:hypothetical protein
VKPWQDCSADVRSNQGFTWVTYSAALDVPRHVIEFLARPST